MKREEVLSTIPLLTVNPSELDQKKAVERKSNEVPNNKSRMVYI